MEYGFAFFPGQGAQAPGMGKDLYENSKAARLVFEEASDGAGIDVAKLCFESDKETLSRTENSQIAIFTHSMAALAGSLRTLTGEKCKTVFHVCSSKNKAVSVCRTDNSAFFTRRADQLTVDDFHAPQNFRIALPESVEKRQ